VRLAPPNLAPSPGHPVSI